MVVKFIEILFGPLHRRSPFLGELRCQAIQTEYGPYIAERTQKAVYIVRCLYGANMSKSEVGEKEEVERQSLPWGSHKEGSVTHHPWGGAQIEFGISYSIRYHA
jgi:hypothetical protein